MTTLAANPEFRFYAICCVILSLQMLLLAGITAAKRSKVQKFVNPEDHKVSFKGATVVDGAEHPEVARVQRAHRNLNESVALFFALGLLCVIAGISPLGAKICFGIFTGARVLHSIAYLNEKQPWRTMMYAFGSFALIGLMVQLSVAMLV